VLAFRRQQGAGYYHLRWEVLSGRDGGKGGHVKPVMNGPAPPPNDRRWPCNCGGAPYSFTRPIVFPSGSVKIAMVTAPGISVTGITTVPPCAVTASSVVWGSGTWT